MRRICRPVVGSLIALGGLASAADAPIAFDDPIVLSGGAFLAVGDVTGDGRGDLVAVDGTWRELHVLPGPVGAGPPIDVVTTFTDGPRWVNDVRLARLPQRADDGRPFVLSVAPDAVPRRAGRYDVELRGAGFRPGATLDFGASGVPAAATVESDSKIRASVVVEPGASTPTRVAVVNPDGGASRAPFSFVPESPPLPERSLDSVTPATSLAGRTVDFLLRGKGMQDVYVVNFGEGVSRVDANGFGPWTIDFSFGVLERGPDYLVVRAKIAADAAPGPRDVTMSMRGSSVADVEPATSGRFEIVAPPTSALGVSGGKLVPARGRRPGLFRAAGLFALAGEGWRAPVPFDPASQSAQIRYGDPASPKSLTVSPLHGVTRVEPNGARTWTSPPGAEPWFRLTLGPGTEFAIDVVGADLLAPVSADVLVELTLNGETGRSVATWKRSRNGRLTLRSAGGRR